MKKRGIGLATGLYPTAMATGGDPGQAIIEVQPDGSVLLLIGTSELGQGSSTVLAQLAAEVLGVDYENIRVVNNDTDICPVSWGSLASRVTYMDGKAVVAAAEEARSILFEVVAEMMEAKPKDLEAIDGKIQVKDSPSLFKTMAEAANFATFEMRKLIVGRGVYMRDRVQPDPETGAMDSIATLAWTAILAEVEVDTETGEVSVLKITCAYDTGTVINPMLSEGQIEGGTAMGIGAALMEELYPVYPSTDLKPDNLGDYVIPTAVDVPEIESVFYECICTHGPFGAKGFGEMTANVPPAAILNAIHDAVGIRITELPASPEKILRALEEKGRS